MIITEICAVIVALVALFIALFEARSTRKHNRLSVKPYFVFRRDANGETLEGKLILENKGLGPAVVKRFVVQIDGKEIELISHENLIKVLKEYTPQFQLQKCQILTYDTVVSAGDERVLFLLKPRIKLPYINIYNALRQFNIIIEYESIYGTKFLIESNDDLK